MRFYSLSDKTYQRSFREVTLAGQAPGRALFFPGSIPNLEKLVSELKHLDPSEIAFQVMKPYLEDEMPDEALRDIVEQVFSFPVPLKRLDDGVSVLELFHGPTLAFKDVGAGFMSRALGYFLRNESKEVTVLVATSGDTGGAVAAGFHNVPGIKVVILYPSGKVSPVQEKQLTALGGNITALEVNGSFDDCQRMVKTAFAAFEGSDRFTSANSINIARWLPQQIYYFLALKQWEGAPPLISVPSGNFGNICAGLLAMRSGLPVKKFIAACNSNDTVPRFIRSGRYEPGTTVATSSNAMDVSDPSNFVRILELFDGNLDEVLEAVSISEDETRKALDTLYEKYKYVADPHGAVAFAGLQSREGIFLETAHPVKFPDLVKEAVMPAALEVLMNSPSHSIKMEARDQDLLDWLA